MPLTPNLRLPRIVRVGASAEYRAAPPPKTILIVDDDRSVTETFGRMLRLEGFNVHTAITAELGLELAITRRPDAIVLDLRMPLLSGVQFLRLLRSNPGLRKIPVAIVTGDYFVDPHVTSELTGLGTSVRFKPLWLKDLVSIARSLTVSPRGPPDLFSPNSRNSDIVQ